jgi:hypothetical protein
MLLAESGVGPLEGLIECSWMQRKAHLHHFSSKARLLLVNLAIYQPVPALVAGRMSPTPNLYGKPSSSFTS